ncbi:hypothetical protein [Hydrogenophaga sp. Root209]|uniref:hypothetical protein n=1 Tax=Hydrogenophaga sp. Root209 TaxID=1736490 RepID=UPI0012E387B5|nr:hypothetical protein [Hydrogenophaga sp. Root209]
MTNFPDRSEGVSEYLSLHITRRARAHARENVCATDADTDQCDLAGNFSAGLLRDWAVKYMSKQGSFGTMSDQISYIDQQLTDELVATNQGVVGSIPASRTKQKTRSHKLRVFSFLPLRTHAGGEGSP